MSQKEKILINDLMAELGLPKGTAFLGYICHLPKTDEFLAGVNYKNGMEKRVWAKMPELSKIYSEQKDAEEEVKKCGKKAVLALLFECEKQYIVLPEEE